MKPCVLDAGHESGLDHRTRKILVRAVPVLWRNSLRSSLILVSAAVGVAGMVCSVNYAAGGSAQLLEQIRRMGTNVLLITPEQSRATAGRARTGALVTTLVERDYAAIRRDVRTRTRSSAVVTGTFRLKAAGLSKTAEVLGCQADYFGIKDWRVEDGDSFDPARGRDVRRVAVLGHTVAMDLFGGESPVGQTMLINRIPFQVIGVLEERGQGLDVGNEDNRVYVPVMTAMHRLMNVEYYSGIVVEIESLAAMDSTAAQIRALLRQLHHTPAGQADDFRIQNQKPLLETQVAAAARLRFFTVWIGLSALVVSGAGILGVSWLAVRERTREIGTRRALGASSGDIFVQILFETAAISVSGCAVGLACAWQLSALIARLSKLPLVFDWKVAWLAMLFAAGMNVAVAILPSRRAARMDPIRALQRE